MDRDPWTSWFDPTALLRAGAALTPVGALEALLRTAGRRLAGRRITVPGSGGELSLRWDAPSLDPDPVGLALGQLDDVRLLASDVRWRDLECHRLVLVCRNVHVRPLPVPVAVAAPVTLELAVRTEVLRRRFAAERPGWALEPAGAGAARLRWARHPSWGSVGVEAEVSGSALLVRPRTLTVGSRRIPLPAWAPARRVALPALPRGLRLREMAVGDDEVVLHLVADEWREQVPTGRLESLLGRLT
ncbi:LmeA family phospholipid-binding protein [Pseudonocardia hydrocarbonoxydans]|uniref:DUF2993 domain-containing protein n=1 Tax=Pseudonocardia hydrocarbonoxydans TaxID=76726 RepID=A0A4Y3WR14_9PSEU|nr:LmeA family phospholipid-binding protein [Pseudonocardia hydrocarbonoxydans]GEC21323.1 hypothetical protein PHY01_36060 [Pseudonocardia hydrocarbonoxydans]